MMHSAWWILVRAHDRLWMMKSSFDLRARRDGCLILQGLMNTSKFGSEIEWPI